jgi:hypothetical protein
MPETRSTRKPAKLTRARTPPVSRAAKLASDVAILIGADAGKNGARDDYGVELARAGGGSPGKPVELMLASGKRIELTSKQWERAHGDLKALVREELASLDADARAAVLDTLAASTSVAGEHSLELSSSLYGIREILRERLPRCAVSREQPAGVAVEAILAVDDSSFWINGWMHDEDGLGQVVAVSPEGARVDVTRDLARTERAGTASRPSSDCRRRACSRAGGSPSFALPTESSWRSSVRSSRATGRS